MFPLLPSGENTVNSLQFRCQPLKCFLGFVNRNRRILIVSGTGLALTYLASRLMKTSSGSHERTFFSLSLISGTNSNTGRYAILAGLGIAGIVYIALRSKKSAPTEVSEALPEDTLKNSNLEPSASEESSKPIPSNDVSETGIREFRRTSSNHNHLDPVTTLTTSTRINESEQLRSKTSDLELSKESGFGFTDSFDDVNRRYQPEQTNDHFTHIAKVIEESNKTNQSSGIRLNIAFKKLTAHLNTKDLAFCSSFLIKLEESKRDFCEKLIPTFDATLTPRSKRYIAEEAGLLEQFDPLFNDLACACLKKAESENMPLSEFEPLMDELVKMNPSSLFNFTCNYLSKKLPEIVDVNHFEIFLKIAEKLYPVKTKEEAATLNTLIAYSAHQFHLQDTWISADELPRFARRIGFLDSKRRDLILHFSLLKLLKADSDIPDLPAFLKSIPDLNLYPPIAREIIGYLYRKPFKNREEIIEKIGRKFPAIQSCLTIALDSKKNSDRIQQIRLQQDQQYALRLYGELNR